MSLINDALKKAQKLQAQGQAHSASSGQAQPPLNPGGAPSAPGVSGAPSRPAGSGGDRSMPGQIFMLLAFGAGVLIALSVLATVYLLRQPAAPVVAQTPTAPVLPEKPALAPVINARPPALSLSNGSNPSSGPAPAQNLAPALVPALEKLPTPPTTASAVAVTRPAPPALPVLRSFSEGGSQPVVSPPALSLSNGSNPSSGPAPSSSSGLDPTKPDPKILAYIDALQVAGVRVTDTGSKVLMNDRVYRENEIVDHLLGLRLKKVESDMLTFVDERGVIYTRNL